MPVETPDAVREVGPRVPGVPVRRFCLITAGNVSNRPRLLKEADCLAAAGYDVRVVALDVDPMVAVRDDATARDRPWTLDRVRMRRGTVAGSYHRAVARGMYELASRARKLGLGGDGVEDRVLTRYLPALERRAVSRHADVFMAHGLEALPVAVRAAARTGAKVGFDSEDLHVGELIDSPETSARIALVRSVERRYLRQCSYLIAGSDGIADALVASYGIPRPAVVLNTFPRLSDSTPVEPRRASSAGSVSLYWFSQVIGSGRGLEMAVMALSLLPGRVELHLRGSADPTFVRELQALATRAGVANRLFFWPEVPPADLIALAAQHDVGLALELNNPSNRDLCVSNKLFVYFAAGLAIAASDTRGQRSVLERVPGAGFLFPQGDAEALAAGIRSLIDQPEVLARAKAAARMAASSELAWDRDAAVLLEHLSGPGVLAAR